VFRKTFCESKKIITAKTHIFSEILSLIQTSENQVMYTRTANEEKIYIKTQINIKYLFVNIKSRI